MISFAIYFRKHSCLVRTFNRHMTVFISNGLIYHWEKQFKIVIDPVEKPGPKELSIDQISGVIQICAALYALCILIFLLEIISPHHEAIKKIIDFFTFK